MNDVEALRTAIRDVHGCESTHLCSVPVHEVFDDESVWQGDVEEFVLKGHPTATTAYAWSSLAEDGTMRQVAVLGIPPIQSASDAVKAENLRRRNP